MSNPEDLNFNNPGGVHRALILDHDGVSDTPDVVFGTHRIDGPITVASGYAWEEDYFTEHTAGHSETETIQKGDNAWTQRVEMFSPLTDGASIKGQVDHERRRYVIDCIDRNGQRRLVGTKEQPLRLVHSYTTNADPAGRKGTIMVFEGVTTERAYFYDPDASELEYTSGSGS